MIHAEYVREWVLIIKPGLRCWYAVKGKLEIYKYIFFIVQKDTKSKGNEKSKRKTYKSMLIFQLNV